ncbi:MAG: metalloregulator ArsR/SmtB family transcription factor [Anaerolineaceae bacterium]|jgi:ArsR family transcriptional regulator
MNECDTPLSSVDFAKALADETRQKIMNLCCCNWLAVSEIVEKLGDVTQPTVSHHLAVLRAAGLVITRNEGKHTFYTLNQERLAVCCGRLIVVFAPQTGAAGAVSATLEI